MQYSFVNPGRFSQVLEFILQHIFANHQKLSGSFYICFFSHQEPFGCLFIIWRGSSCKTGSMAGKRSLHEGFIDRLFSRQAPGKFQSYTILKDIGMNSGHEGSGGHSDLFSPDDHLLAPMVDLASRLAEYRIILENDVGENEDPLMRMTDMKPYLERLWVYKEWMGRFVQQ